MVRIQSGDPLGGGGRHEETGEAPHGHGHRRPLGEVGQGQQHPVAHHGGLACGVERLEHLERQKQVDGLRTGTIKLLRIQTVNDYLAQRKKTCVKVCMPLCYFNCSGWIEPQEE